jgi:Dockerin type I domain
MNASKDSRRVRRHRQLIPEALEARMVMSAGQGSTFAIMPGSITTSGQIATIPFKIDPALFTAPKGKIVLGIDIAPATQTSTGTTTDTSSSASFEPETISIISSSGHVIRLEHARYDPKVAKADHLEGVPTSAALVTLPVPKNGQSAADYSLQIKGMHGTTGQFLVGFYLPGDVAGTGTVTKSDIQTIKKDRGMTANNSNYNFDADVNRDGIINSADLQVAREDLGVTTLVSPVISVNLDPNSDPGGNNVSPYSTVHFAGEATPDATVTFLDQASGTTTQTTVESNGTYSIMVPLIQGSNTFTVTTMDGFGQSISGSITPVVYSPTSAANTPGTSSSSSSS